jgi:hypothetical protein
MISGLGVMSFRTSTRLLHFRADRIEQSEEPGLLTQNPTQSQKSLNRKLVYRFLLFPMIISMPSYDKQSRSYDVLNIDRANEISGLIRFEQSENFKLLGLVQVQSQKTSNTKHVINFLNFPFITDTVKSNQRRRSYNHCKLAVLLKIHFWTDQATWANLDFNPTSIGELEEPRIQMS